MGLSSTYQLLMSKIELRNFAPCQRIAFFVLFLLVKFAIIQYHGKSIWKKWSLANKSNNTLSFTNIQPQLDFNFKETKPQEYRPWKAGRYNMTMGIRQMQEEEWLKIDNLYEQEQIFRRNLLENHRGEVLQCLPDAEAASEEALECIIGFLTARYPTQFQLSKDKNYIYNAITKQTFKVVAPYKQHPLEIAAQLIQEDINLMIRGNEDDYYLRASLTAAPAGWYLRERMGWPLWKIHAPVPFWNEKLRKAMKNFFLRLKIDNPVERNNYFVQVGDNLFQQEPFPESLSITPHINEIHIRYERQTLRRLPRTGAVIFTVRTYIKPLTDLWEEVDSIRSLRAAVNAWPPLMAKYKGRSVWGEVFENWCEKILGDPQSYELK